MASLLVVGGVVVRQRHTPGALADRILDRRTASEIIEDMIPEAEKQARARRLFAPIVAARDAAERAKHERRWAAEEQEQSNV